MLRKELKVSKLKIFMLSFFTLVSIASAGEINLLVDRLVDKEILTAGEGQEILVLTKENAKKEIAKGANESLPLWIQTMTLGGDFRYRYQWENQRTTSSANKIIATDRTRERIRFRLKGDAKVNKSIGVAFGIATGNSTDSRSTNQTFDDNFSKKIIWLDYAYSYMNLPVGSVLNIGRIPVKTAFWNPTDFIWDTDINVDGLNLNYEKGNVFTKIGRYSIKEVSTFNSKTADDAYLLNGQIGYSFAGLKSAISYYQFENIATTSTISGVSVTNLANTAGTNSALVHKDLCVSSEYTLNDILMFKKISLAGEYVINTAISGKSSDKKTNYDYEKDAYIALIKFSSAKKIANFGDYEFSISFRDFGKEAFVDSYPDSDFYAGKTGVKGWEYILNFGLTKNTSLALDYYDTTLRNGKDRNQIVQLDLNYKF